MDRTVFEAWIFLSCTINTMSLCAQGSLKSISPILVDPEERKKSEIKTDQSHERSLSKHQLFTKMQLDIGNEPTL